MKYKVSELEGALLDAAVAKAEGVECFYDAHCYPASPSTEWEIGGQIIESERIGLGYIPRFKSDSDFWYASIVDETRQVPDFSDGGTHGLIVNGSGPTPLIAAMRAYVASKFGEEVEL